VLQFGLTGEMQEEIFKVLQLIQSSLMQENTEVKENQTN
jgi:hypothetical protein